MRRKMFIALPIFAALLSVTAFSQTLPSGVQKVTSVEGITEYAFPNGLHVLLFPDNSKSKVTVNMTILVGSRHEGYGETGMAHLLEHMVFKTTKSGRDIFKDLTDRGASFNGTTDYDRTNYFETLNASDENLRWALALEADRLVNMTMKKADLDTEMTVVRNEMERGENSPMNVLEERVLASAYNFHNYGKTVIGNRTDVERVPIDRLAAFYQKYYQPDDVLLTVAGQIDESKTLAMVMQTVGAIPKPTRVLPQTYTAEPTQEGERSVMLRRVGEIQAVMLAYHIPAALHSDMAAIDVLAQVLGASQTGRLYKGLVDNKKATSASAFARSMHDPGTFFAYAQLKPDQSIDEAQQILLKTVEGLVAEPPSQEEVERAKARILKGYELALTNTERIGLTMSETAASGDWRLLFLERDELRKITPEDVTRVAKAYLKSSNRTMGEFIPTKSPDRAEIPDAPTASARLKDYKGGEIIQQGEVFDSSPKNIESRVTRFKLPNGLKVVMLPKKTRGGTVVATMNVRFGDEKSLFGKASVGALTGSLLMRGTKNKSRQQIQDETDRLKAQINVGGGVNFAQGQVQTLEANLGGALTLVRELLREPSFPQADFELLRQQRIGAIESSKTEPGSLAQLELSRHMNARYPRGDVRYAATLDEQIEDYKKVTIDDIHKFYDQFYGVGDGEMVIVGQFDAAQVRKLVTDLFGDWKSPGGFARITNSYTSVAPMNHNIETPDKANAVFVASVFSKMTDEDPDLAAVTIANMVFGGSPNSRLFQRIRVKDGLSYGVNSGMSVPTKDDGARFSVSATAAPQLMPKLEAAFNEEMAKAIKDGFTPDEVSKAKQAWLDERKVGRSEDTSIASALMTRERWGRTMDWDAKLEAAVAALTPEQVSASFKAHIDPSALTVVKGGDFKKVNVYQ